PPPAVSGPRPLYRSGSVGQARRGGVRGAGGGQAGDGRYPGGRGDPRLAAPPPAHLPRGPGPVPGRRPGRGVIVGGFLALPPLLPPGMSTRRSQVIACGLVTLAVATVL